MCCFLCSPVLWGVQGKQPSKIPAISGIQPRAMIPFLPTEPPNQPHLQQQAPALFTGEHHAQSSEMRRKRQRRKGPSLPSLFRVLVLLSMECSEKPMNGLQWRADRLPRVDTALCKGALLINHLFPGYQSPVLSFGKNTLTQLHQQICHVCCGSEYKELLSQTAQLSQVWYCRRQCHGTRKQGICCCAVTR